MQFKSMDSSIILMFHIFVCFVFAWQCHSMIENILRYFANKYKTVIVCTMHKTHTQDTHKTK